MGVITLVGNIMVYCPVCEAKIRVKVYFNDCNRGFKTTTAICPKCQSSIIIKDTNMYNGTGKIVTD